MAITWPRGVMVSTQDSESCDPSSNLGGTFSGLFCLTYKIANSVVLYEDLGHGHTTI